jgi:hypothetical protein
MNHESIARVYDAGLTDQGQPFVAMQLIDAQPLHRACETMRLDTRQRVELMAQVCDAIQHAHQRAVIHRDLKPANILVEQTSDSIVPRVIDFGIAKLLEDDPNSPHTRASVRLGTPRYMSPEQRTGSDTSDTRVDVYALGAILCELLAGDVPTATNSTTGETDSTITRPSKIASEQTQRTVTHPKTLRGDLDRIVLKACADDPDLRYPSAQAMGEDLRNYLSGRPVSASPPGVVYLTRKFVRRHRASVSLAGVLGVALLVTMGVAAIKWREASIERDRAQESTNRVAFISDFLLEMLLLSADHNARGAPPILTESAMQEIADRAKAGLSDDPEHMLPMLVGIGRFQTQSGYPETGTQTLREALDFAIEYHGIPSEEVVELRVSLHDELDRSIVIAQLVAELPEDDLRDDDLGVTLRPLPFSQFQGLLHGVLGLRELTGVLVEAGELEECVGVLERVGALASLGGFHIGECVGDAFARAAEFAEYACE